MTVEDWIRLVGNVGVPAVMAGVVLIRLDASVRAVERVLTVLVERLDRVIDRERVP
jgi:hypothetical protein